MAALTPEQLQALAQQFSSNTRPRETSYGGYSYIPQWQTQYSGQDTQLDPTIGGYRRYVPGTGDQAGKFDGLTYEDIDTSGNVTGTGQFSGIDGGSLWDYGPFLMAALPFAATIAGMPAAGAGAELGANGAFLGEGAASGIPAWDGAAAAASGGGSAVGGAGGFVGEGVKSGVGAWDAAATKAAATSLLPAGASSLLGPAATVIGAVAGGQGTPGQTTEKRMDPRLDKYVYDDLMPKVQGLLNSQMPLAQQAGAQMRQIGGGLLNAPIAQNGFGLFTKGRY